MWESTNNMRLRYSLKRWPESLMSQGSLNAIGTIFIEEQKKQFQGMHLNQEVM
jgi:hypothetical protein